MGHFLPIYICHSYNYLPGILKQVPLDIVFLGRWSGGHLSPWTGEAPAPRST